MNDPPPPPPCVCPAGLRRKIEILSYDRLGRLSRTGRKSQSGHSFMKTLDLGTPSRFAFLRVQRFRVLV